MTARTLHDEAIDALLLAENAAQAFWTEFASDDTVNALFVLAIRRRREVLAKLERSYPPMPLQIKPERIRPLQLSK